MKDCKCHWEGSVFYADPDCILDKSNPRYFENLKHDVPPSVPERLWEIVKNDILARYDSAEERLEAQYRMRDGPR